MLAACLLNACVMLAQCFLVFFGCFQDARFWNLHDTPRYAQGTEPKPHLKKKGLRDRNSPTCTLSQNGYGTSNRLPLYRGFAGAMLALPWSPRVVLFSRCA